MDDRGVLFEVCVDSAVGALAAADGGADRVELCANLLEGGTTPSAGSVSLVVDRLSIGVMVLVRPRGGDFVYTDDEVEVMLRDIASLRETGVRGVVSGALLPDGTLDLGTTTRLVEASLGMEFTFHRAFDMCVDPRAALAQLMDLGVDRILTSGQQDAAADGLSLISDLVASAGDRLIIMPGGGITEQDIARVVNESGCREVHFAAGATRQSPMVWRNEDCRMGCGDVPGEYELRVTSAERVREYVRRCGA